MNHIAAIHVLKAKLRMADEDYRALLQGLTGKQSSKAMSVPELERVRAHLQQRAEEAGVTDARPASAWAQKRAAASPMERKVWALWNQLGRDGAIENPSPQALRAWVKRQTGMDDLKFCNWAQLSNCIEALKDWKWRFDDENDK